ncbi:UNVERIFIED_CONTAM: hypothetical protein GTU68_061146, partial [Idotea baltica]|nr:hypothetical protein [Idotea baltica]
DLCNVSRRLTSEFLNYVIESRALRKAFISIKGYFYRAHIQGQEVTWMIPHPFTPERNINSDVRVMRVFMEFYCTMLSFVNFKLFQSLNLYYPPRLTSKIKGKVGAVETKRDVLVNSIEALSLPLKKNFVDVAQEDEDYEETLMENPKYSKKLKLAKEEREKVRKQVSLFEGVKFFLGRETNRESLTLLIRCGGGLVSWDRSLGPGSTYQEDDKNILYQIVDRPTCEKKYMTRYYIQPQWVYDSFNAGLILPVQSYFVGAALPAHLSPFEERNHPIYTPPEMLKLKALQGKVDLVGDTEDPFEKFEEKEEEGEREEE